MPGCFIVLDGPDGAGTTAHTRFLSERLTAEGYDVLTTAEPTSGPIGAWIRTQLKTHGDLSPLSLQMLFCADRVWHIDKIIQPALDAGKIVICDRYAPSTIVYAEAQGLDTKMLKDLNNAFLRPNKTIFTLPPLEVSLERIAKRDEKEFFESTELQKRIHDGYGWMAREDASITLVDTSQSKQDSAKEVYMAVAPLLRR